MSNLDDCIDLEVGMFGRGTLFVGVLVAAVAIPFFLVGEDSNPGRRLAGLWNSMLESDQRQPKYGSPVPSTSPIPPRGSARQTVNPWPNAPSPTFPAPGATSRLPSAAGSTTGLPPGATATPWMPVDGSAPASPYAPTATYPGIAQSGGPTMPGGMVGNNPATRMGPRVQQAADFFRFDITPDWVVQNWPRVSSQLAEFSYTGLRVPVVSGTGIHDLAGSMTYYFDSQQVLQRMTFVGTTGDPTQLVQLATTRFGLQQETALNGQCYVKRDKSLVTDILRVKHAAVATGIRPHQRYKVAMELNRPGNPQGLSAINARMLEHERKIMEVGRPTAPSPRP